MKNYEIFSLGDVLLQKGSVLKNAKLAYKTLGELNRNKDNVIVCPTWFTGYIDDVIPIFVGEGRAIDPNKYLNFIVNFIRKGWNKKGLFFLEYGGIWF